MELAEHTKISLSQINRIRSGKTARPHLNTLRTLAAALNTTVAWLRDGVHEEQLDAFAATIPSVEEAKKADPLEKVRVLLNELRFLPREAQVKACRAAVSAMLDALAGAGQMVPEAYQSLVYLDGIGSVTRSARGNEGVAHDLQEGSR
jgi:transcriptional regulator with XRE-family HTH domain